MKMTITLDGVPDDFAPLLASLPCAAAAESPPPLPDDPVAWFRGLLKDAGLHSEDVAAAIGLPPSCLSARVRGRTPWTLPEAAEVCKALGADISVFARVFCDLPTSCRNLSKEKTQHEKI